MHIGRFGGNHIRSGISFETGKIRQENVGAGGPDQINEAEKLWTAVCPGLSWEPVCLVEGTLVLQQVNVVLDYIE